MADTVEEYAELQKRYCDAVMEYGALIARARSALVALVGDWASVARPGASKPKPTAAAKGGFNPTAWPTGEQISAAVANAQKAWGDFDMFYYGLSITAKGVLEPPEAVHARACAASAKAYGGETH